MFRAIVSIGRRLFPAQNSDEIILARHAALANTIPFLYVILTVNGWTLTANFYNSAPHWLTVQVSVVLTAVCVYRLLVWWRRRRAVLEVSRARLELGRMRVLAGVLSAAFPLWSFMLFPFGDAYAQSHVAFFMAVSMIGCVLCLAYLPSAALTVAAIGGGAFTLFFSFTGNPALMAMALNLVLVSVVLAALVLVQGRNFDRMVNAQTEARRREQDQGRLMRMISDMPIAVMTVDPDTLTVTYANPAATDVIRRIEHLLPISVDQLVGAGIDMFHADPTDYRSLLADPANLPHHARVQLGSEVIDLKMSEVTSDDGGYLGPMLTCEIVTKEIEAETRIRELAHLDTLTGLLNRYTFLERLETGLASRSPELAVLFIDLDGFKLVNDTKGHVVGDVLLAEVAGRLKRDCPDGSVISRLGGDEFAILVAGPDDVDALGQSVIEALSAIYTLDDGRQIRIGASVGVALAPEHGDDADALLARADMALYAAKAAGKGVVRTFHPDMEVDVRRRVQVEASLRDALDRGDELFVFYQPIVDLRDGRVTAREALSRWHQGERGWVPPDEFIPVAEESGLIDRLGEFVLRQACSEAAGWSDETRVAVNVSASQLGKGILPAVVLAALVDSGLSPNRLELEVTETAIMDSARDTVGELRRIRALGVRIALDDFGTGYSSLAHLRAFPFDKIKIDGSFVREAADRVECAAVVRAVAELGSRLGVTTVAEGVESDGHLDRIRREGCAEAQGYYFGRPEPTEADQQRIAALGALTRRSSAA